MTVKAEDKERKVTHPSAASAADMMLGRKGRSRVEGREWEVIKKMVSTTQRKGERLLGGSRRWYGMVLDVISRTPLKSVWVQTEKERNSSHFSICLGYFSNSNWDC
jgi:hypothetical protein